MNAVLQALLFANEFRQFFVDAENERTEKKSSSLSLRRVDTAACLVEVQTQQKKKQSPSPSQSRKRRRRYSNVSNSVSKVESVTSMCFQLHALLRVLWSRKWLVVTPYALLESVWRYLPSQFRNYQQQDAQEFFLALADRIGQELNDDASDGVVHSIFGGVVASKVVCGNAKCRNESITKQQFLDVELEIPNVSLAKRRGRSSGRSALDRNEQAVCTLDECFAAHCQEEVVEGYFCDACKKTTDATRSVYFESLPPVLCVALKRFSWTAASQNRAKIDTRVQFPTEILDLTSYKNSSPDSDTDSTSDSNSSATSYHFVSAVIHHGNRLTSGHYTTLVRDVESRKPRFLHLNDAVTELVDFDSEEVADFQSGAYLLFYELRN